MADLPSYILRGDDGEEYGPVEMPELREWVTENRVGLGSSVKLNEPGELWQPWQYFPELVALLAEANVVGTPILAPWSRRIAAGLLDLILCLLLMIPPFVATFFLLPTDTLVDLNRMTQEVLAGVVPAPSLKPVFPVWFTLAFYAIYFGIPTLYFTAFIAAHGRTPAKSLMQLQVVDLQRNKPMLGKALLRALFYLFSLFFLLGGVVELGLVGLIYGLPLFYGFIHPQRRALHDIVAGTYVVER